MLIEHSIVLVMIGLAIIALTLDMVRRRILLTNYSLFWVFLGCIFILWGVVPSLLFRFAHWFGIHHITLVLFTIFVFLFLEILHTGSILTLHSRRQIEIIQQLALLEWRLRKLSQTLSCREKEKESDEQG
jgi:hypothetical protein